MRIEEYQHFGHSNSYPRFREPTRQEPHSAKLQFSTAFLRFIRIKETTSFSSLCHDAIDADSAAGAATLIILEKSYHVQL